MVVRPHPRLPDTAAAQRIIARATELLLERDDLTVRAAIFMAASEDVFLHGGATGEVPRGLLHDKETP